MGASAGTCVTQPEERVARCWAGNVIVLQKSRLNGGEGGIRTLDTLSRIHTFQACSFSHSDTSP